MRPVIAYPGVAGSFSESAAQCAFPQGETRGYATFAQAAEAAQNGAADYALLPVENSFAGAVLPTYGLLEGLQLHIVGETLRRVRHQLVALPGATIEGLRDHFLPPPGHRPVRRLPGHGALGASGALGQHGPSAPRRWPPSGDLTRAAIASTRAAERYGLTVLRADIQTSQTNTTRFLILSREETPLAAPDKATVVFRVNDEVGALARVLASFAGKRPEHVPHRVPAPAGNALSVFSSPRTLWAPWTRRTCAAPWTRPAPSPGKSACWGSIPGGRCRIPDALKGAGVLAKRFAASSLRVKPCLARRVSPLRRRPGGFPLAPWTPSGPTP